jgi:hypothetical protein
MTDKDEIKLGRVGHYTVADEVCQEASIVHVYPPTFDSDGGATVQVNIHGHTPDGDCFSRRHVTFGGEFHLNRDCPWEH